VFGGWEWSLIATARTGLPVNVTVDRSASAVPDGNSLSPQRPNLISGVSLIPSGGATVNDWINAAASSVPPMEPLATQDETWCEVPDSGRPTRRDAFLG